MFVVVVAFVRTKELPIVLTMTMVLALIHGRETIDELVNCLGGVEDKLLVLTVNALRQDLFLKDYTEEDGTKTLESVEFKERNRALGIDAKLLEDLEKKAAEKKEQKRVKKIEDMGLSNVRIIE